MPRKQNVPPTDNQPESKDYIRAELDALVVAKRSLGIAAIHKIRDACCELVTEKLGPGDIGEFHVSYDTSMGLHNPGQRVMMDAVPKLTRNRSVSDEMKGITTMLDIYNAAIEEALLVF